MGDRSVVTGAFSYSGHYITQRLLERGEEVVTLVRRPPPPELLPKGVRAIRYDAPDAEILAEISGARCFFNTFWVRFEKDRTTFRSAVDTSRRLVHLARDAQIGRFVHVSITKPSLEGPPYFAGKAMVEDILGGSGLSHSIVRPTTLFGGIDVFMNNLAWLLRRFPVFTIPGDGQYRLQPIHVDDLAGICLEASDRTHDEVIDAAGPEIFTFRQLLETLRKATGSRCLILPTPRWAALGLAKLIGAFVSDVVVTPQEIEGLMSELIVSDQPPSGTTSFTAWAMANGASLGTRYESEIRRNYRHTV